MKTTAKILAFMLNIFAVCFCVAQDAVSKSNSLKDFSLSQQLYFLNNQKSTQNIQVLQNTIYVEQIGSNNTISSFQKSNLSDIQLNQYGIGNTIINTVNAPSIQQYILQYGNQNSIVNNLYSQTLIHNTIVQKGNKLNLFNYGNNSISNNLKIYMTGNDNTLIIKNFNMPKL